MKKVLLLILAVILFISLVGLLTQRIQQGKISLPSQTTPAIPPAKKEIKINEAEIPVEIVDTAQKRQKGLSKREPLPEGEGMLFVFEQENVRQAFWMKDMKFAIDIIWVDNGEIVQIDKDTQPPEPGIPDSELKLYAPNQPIDYVLEVNAGFSEENNINVGDEVNLSGIFNN